MGCYIGSAGNYYEGERQDFDTEVEKRPSPQHNWVGGAWVLDLGTAKEVKLTTINQSCTDLLAGVKAGCPDDEVQSWSKQESEARAYVADNTAATPLLAAMSSAREVPLADLAARVIEKADLFAVASGQIIGRRQLREDQINAATTADAVLAIVW